MISAFPQFLQRHPALLPSVQHTLGTRERLRSKCCSPQPAASRQPLQKKKEDFPETPKFAKINNSQEFVNLQIQSFSSSSAKRCPRFNSCLSPF